jgi:hypothetical protein
MVVSKALFLASTNPYPNPPSEGSTVPSDPIIKVLYFTVIIPSEAAQVPSQTLTGGWPARYLVPVEELV